MTSSLLGKYREHDISFDANENHVHNEVGDQIIFLGGSGSFTFKIDGGQPNQVRAGIAFKMPDGQNFEKVSFTETAGASGNILFAIAAGNVVDARSVISGETPILNAASPNDVLNVADATLQSSTLQRMALNDLRSATKFTHNPSSASTSEVVSAASNTDGIYLHHCAILGTAYNTNGSLWIGAVNTGTLLVANSRYSNANIQGLILPSGLALNARIDGGETAANRCTVSGFYTLL